MARNTPNVDGVTWWDYVQRISESAPNVRIAEATGVSPSSISRWRAGGVDAATAAAFARGYGRPVLEAFIAAGFLTPDEAGEQPAAAPNLAVLDDAALLDEVARRMREGGSDADAEPRKKSPSGGGGDATVRRLTPKQQRFQEQALPQMDAAEHPKRDRGPDGRRR